MPDLVKISELGAALTLTGAELTPVVQSGVTVRTTLQAIADLAPVDLNVSELQQALSAYDIADWSCNAMNNSSSGAARGISQTTLTAGFAVSQADPTSAIALLNNRYVQDSTPAQANRRGGVYSSDSDTKHVFRRLSGDAARGGFYYFARFSFLVADNQQRAFCGLMEGVSPPGISAVMNDIVNAIGLGKDEGDTNLSIVHQGASGGATKADLGITISSIQAKTVELKLTAAPGGTTVDYAVHIVETAATYTGTLSSALPAADAAMYPIHWINAGAQNAAMQVGVNRITVWTKAG